MVLVITEIYPLYSIEQNYFIEPHYFIEQNYFGSYIVSLGTLAVGIIIAYFFRAKQKFSRNILFLSIALSLVFILISNPHIFYIGESIFQEFFFTLIEISGFLPIAVYAAVARSYKGLYKHPKLTILLGLIALSFSMYLLWISMYLLGVFQPSPPLCCS